MIDQPIADGFAYSASMLLLPTTYRAHALAQMDVLRRARGYRNRQYCIPNNLLNPVIAFSQVEEQVNITPGSYLWGIGFSAPASQNDTVTGNVNGQIHIQVTDACTETPLLSDYAFAYQVESLAPGTSQGGVTAATNRRNPMILAQPVLIGEPGLIDVEVYNRAVTSAGVGVDVSCQVVLFFAELSVPPDSMLRLLVNAGLLDKEYI